MRAALAALLLAVASGAQPSVQVEIETVALSGTPAPGAPADSFFDAIEFELAGDGTLLLQTVSPPCASGDLCGSPMYRWAYDTSGWQIFHPGEGDAAPAPQGAVFSEVGGHVHGASFDSWDDALPALNEAGEAAFYGLIEDGIGGAPIGSGIWVADGAGGVATVARSGEQASGAEPGTVFTGFTPDHLVLADTGEVAFSAGLDGPGAPGIPTKRSGAQTERVVRAR
jgi:hypothetical protein